MSRLLDKIIAGRKTEAIEYEEYLKRIAELIRGVEAGLADDAPERLKRSPGLRAIYNYLKKAGETPARAARMGEALGEYPHSKDPDLEKATEIDAAVKKKGPDGWRGVLTKERIIQNTLYEILKDEDLVEPIFQIVKAQDEY